MHSSRSSTSSSSFLNEDFCRCPSNYEIAAKLQLQHDIRLPNIVVFTVSLNEYNLCLTRKRFSIDIQLLSYSFLIRLINRTFQLHSNYTLVAKESTSFKGNFPVTDDFDLDGCIMNIVDEHADVHKQHTMLEFIVYTYPRTKEQIQYESGDWCVVDNQNSPKREDNFEVLQIQEDCILVTVKPKDIRQETFLQRATGWLHGSVNSTTNNSLTKKEFIQMLDPATGCLLDEPAFRQRIFDTGCEESIRKIVWCYLLRVFNESMTTDDRNQYKIKAKERYQTIRQEWEIRHQQGDCDILALHTLIEKDVLRTDRSVKFFECKESLSQKKLHNILMTYAYHHPEPGYAQGMNDMAAPILYVVRDEALAYACFCALMHHMNPLFHANGEAMHRRIDLLRKTIRAIDMDLWTKIEQCDIGKLIFTYRWLLLDCKREFPFRDVFSVLETLWAALPIDRFESSVDHIFLQPDERPSSSTRSSRMSSLSNTVSSSRSSSPILERTPSQRSSLDGADSGYRDEQIPGLYDVNLPTQKGAYLTARTNSSLPTNIPLGKWLTHFSSIDDDEHYSDMFTIFLCVALLEQNRSLIMQMCPTNTDDDDLLGSFFLRLVRQHDAKHTLHLARNYHRQYVIFQMRVKQLLVSTDN